MPVVCKFSELDLL